MAHPQQYAVIIELATLLRKNGDKILTGESKLSLTTQSLSYLNSAFRRYSEIKHEQQKETNSKRNNRLTKEQEQLQQWRTNVQFLHDFITKTVSLKITHGTATMQGPIFISRFRGLKILELRRVPLHMVEGLQKLRGQLELVIVSRSLQNIQDFFETCGGDMSAPLSWPQLKSAYLSYNGFLKLDASLRLLPDLEVLDISHNSIDKTENYLEYLTELTRLNLGYNFIDSVPTFSLSVKARLKTLVLRNNNLDNIEGVHELFNLVELDVSENCLTDHLCLDVLTDLHKLNMLCLQGNPLSYHKNHRQLCLQHVSSLAVRNGMILDGKKVTSVEIMAKSNIERLSVSRRLSQQAESIVTSTQRVKEYEKVSGSYSFEDSESIATSMRRGTRKSKKKRSRTKTKGLDESDSLLSTGEVSTTDMSSRESSRAPSPVRIVEGQGSTKEDIEVIRDHYGVNWLQVMANKNTLSTEKSTSDGHSSSQERSPSTQNNTAAPSTNQQQSTEKNPTNQTEDDIYLNESMVGIQGNSSHDIEDDIEVLSEPENSESVVPSNGVMQSSGEFYMSEPMLDTPTLERMNSSKGAEWDRYDEQDTYYGEESEPFIILLPNEELHQLIVTVNQRYIIEKDLNGKVVEMLDLKCLQSLARSYEEIKHQNLAEGTEMIVLRMKFDYMRKDRRERTYIMEDGEFADSLEELLNPFIKARELDKRLKGMLQCLKCSEQFHDSEAHVSVQLPKRQKNALNGNKDCSIKHKCPKCASEMVVQLDIQQKPSSRETTPAGSLTSQSGFPDLMGSGKKSPVKLDSKSEMLPSSPIAKSTPLSKVRPSTVEVPTSLDVNKEEGPGFTVSRPRAHAFVSDKMSVSEIYRKSDNLTDVPVKSISKSCSAGKNLNSMDNFMSTSASYNFGSTQTQCWSDVQNALTNQKGRSNRNSTDSDISILTATSESSIAVISDTNVESSNSEKLQNLSEIHASGEIANRSVEKSDISPATQNVHKIQNLHGISEEGEVTPLGSPLSTSICSSMVSSVYENSIAATSTENLTEENNAGKSEQNKKNIEKSDIVIDNNNGDLSIYDSNSIYDVSQNTSTLYMSCNEMSENGIDNKSTEITEDSFVSGDPQTLFPEHDTVENMETSTSNLESSWLSSFDSSSDTDYTKIDHNLKLFLLMHLLEDGDECQFSIKCDIVQYMELEEYKGILLFSSSRILVLRIFSEDDSEPIEKCLKCVENQPITELQYIDIGLGYQSFRFEFDTECSSFSFIIQDENHCKQFINLVTNLVQDTGFSEDSKLQRISKYSETTMGNLQNVVWSQFKQDLIDDEEVFTLVKYLSGVLSVSEESNDGTELRSEIVGIVITDIDISLVKENHQWPLPRLQAPLGEDIKGQQFTLKDRQKINNIATVEVCEETGVKVRLTFFNEESQEEVNWVVTMETSNSIKSLINAIKEPWKSAFGIELEITPVSFAVS